MKKLNKYSALHLSNERFAKSNLRLLSYNAKLKDEIKELKLKKDEYQPDDRICIFYVTDRIYELQQITNNEKLQKAIREFKDELLHNIAVDVMIKRSTN
jgi:hypothetical protein